MPVPPSAPAPVSIGLRSFREQHRESEKLGLTETLLGAERYRSILEIGCGAGELASRLAGRCGRYTGLDDEPASLAAAGRAVRAGHFLPLALRPDEPFRLPAGEHELIVLSETLHRLDAARLGRLAAALDAHIACREIVVVSSLPPPGAGDESVVEASGEPAETLGARIARLETHVLAVRGHYRIDALLPVDDEPSPLPPDGRRSAGTMDGAAAVATVANEPGAGTV